MCLSSCHWGPMRADLRLQFSGILLQLCNLPAQGAWGCCSCLCLCFFICKMQTITVSLEESLRESNDLMHYLCLNSDWSRGRMKSAPASGQSGPRARAHNSRATVNRSVVEDSWALAVQMALIIFPGHAFLTRVGRWWMSEALQKNCWWLWNRYTCQAKTEDKIRFVSRFWTWVIRRMILPLISMNYKESCSIASNLGGPWSLKKGN